MPDAATHYQVLPNGLTLLLRESRLAPVVDLQFWAQVGSADEGPGEQGLAHFHEHMLFKGTARRDVGDVAGEIEGAGGRINAYTSFDVTVYHATLPSDVVDTGVDVLADVVRHSRFDSTEIEREVEVVLEEIRRGEDSPYQVLGDAVFAQAFRVHPYGAPILGTADSVSRFDRERVLSFFRRWYTPANLVFVAVGDFDARAVIEQVRDAFADAEGGRVERTRSSEPTQRELRDVILRRTFERTRLDLAWPSSRFRSPDATHLDLLSFLLGECESSRLVQRLRERDGVVDRIDSGCYTPLDPGLFSVSIELDAPRVRDAVAAVVREVERLRAEPVRPDELERARANFLATEHFERESVSGLARKLGSFQVLGGDWRGEQQYFEQIRGATPDDLWRVAREYLAPEQLTVGVLLPEGEAEALDRSAIEAAVADGLEQTRRTFRSPTALPPALEIHSFRLPNGARLHVAPRRELPVVAVRSALLGGLLSESEASAGITHFLTDLWLRGTRARSAADFARAVENLAADIDGFSGRNSLGLTLEVTSDRLEASLDLFAEALLEPGFDPQEIERERRETLASIERREDNLPQLAFRLFCETQYAHHPYRLTALGTRESVEGIDAAAIRAHHDRLVHGENLVIGVAGDVDPEAIAEALSVRLAPLASDGFVAPAPTLEEAPGEIRCAELRRDRAQAHLVLGFRGLTVLDPHRHALEVIAQLLAGQGGRLFLELRDRRSLAYALNAMNVEGVAPGFFSVYIATAPEKIEAARSGILEQLERLVVETAADEELARAKRHLIGTFAIDRQRSTARAAHLALDALYGLGPDADRRYPEQIEAVSKQDVLDVAQQILRLDAYTLAIVHP
ncbi:MAG: pitrilysin family protein [Myxococcota bacterium]